MTAPTQDDEKQFTALVERHRRELQVHCYRMLGSFDESQDAVRADVVDPAAPAYPLRDLVADAAAWCPARRTSSGWGWAAGSRNCWRSTIPGPSPR